MVSLSWRLLRGVCLKAPSGHLTAVILKSASFLGNIQASADTASYLPWPCDFDPGAVHI